MKKLSLFILCFATIVMAKQDRPNIVWLVSEDNSASWLKLYNENGAAMPNVEMLAANGLVFNHAFSCGVVCSVARSTIISGCYAPRTGTEYHRKQRSVPMPEGIRMFPYYLRQAGYYTTNCSKEDYNFNRNEKAGVWNASNKEASYQNRAAEQPFFHVQNYGTTHESSLHFADTKQPTKTSTDNVALYAYHPDTDTFRYTYARYLDNHMKLDAQLGDFIKGLEIEGLLDSLNLLIFPPPCSILRASKFRRVLMDMLSWERALNLRN